MILWCGWPKLAVIIDEDPDLILDMNDHIGLAIVIGVSELLSLIRKCGVEKERSKKQQRRRWYEDENVAKSRRMGSGNLRDGRIGRCTTHRSVGQAGLGLGRKSLGLLACEHAQLGRYACGLSVPSKPGHQP